MGKDRGYQDGGGLCSPGRWPRFRRAGCFDKGKRIVRMAKALLVESLGSEDNILDLMLRIAAGKFEVCPFKDPVVVSLRCWFVSYLDVPEADQGVAQGQEMYLGILSYLLKAFDDPDWEYPKSISEGVALGVGGGSTESPTGLRRESEVDFGGAGW